MFGEGTFLLALTVTGLGSAALVALAGAALLRRRSWPYFLVTVALGSLALRTFLGAVTIGGFVSLHAHHVLEHLLDALVVGLLFAAVYAARTVAPDPPLDDHESSRLGEPNE